MRDMSTEVRNLVSGSSYSAHLQVWVEDPDGTYRNLGDLAGKNWQCGFERTYGVDAVAQAVTIELWREDGEHSLAPLMGGSALNRTSGGAYARFLEEGRGFFIRTANTATGVAPVPSDWWELIRGEIDRVEWPGRKSRVKLSCRDLAGVLLDTQIEEELEYGYDGQPMEAGLQLLLTRWFPGVELYTPVSPEKPIPKLTAGRGSLLERVREVAQGIGWDVRYLFDSIAEAFRLTLFQPVRDLQDPVFTFTPSLYKDVIALATDRQMVRNRFTCNFVDAATGRPSKVTRENVVSRQKYGPRWMGFDEEEGSVINSAARAEDFLAAADHDVSEALADQEIEALFLPFFEQGDRVRFEPNYIHYDSAQEFSVVGGRDRFYPRERRSWISTRGRPVGMHRLWHKRAVGAPTAGEYHIYDLAVDEALSTKTHRALRFRASASVTEVHGAARAIAGDVISEQMIAQVRSDDALEYVSDGSGVIMVPRPEWFEISLAWLQPWIDGRPLDLGGVLFSITGTAAPVEIIVEKVRLSSEMEELRFFVIDPRGVVTGVRIDHQQVQDRVQGPFVATNAGGYYSHVVPLDPEHITYVTASLIRSDLGDRKTQTLELDWDETPAQPIVRESRDGSSVRLDVDAPDTDTATLWYREVVDDEPGPEEAVPLRGADPRYGVIELSVGAVARRLHVYGRNARNDAGPYTDFRVAPSQVAVTAPRIIRADVVGTELQVLANDATLSVYAQYWNPITEMLVWDAWSPGQGATFTVPVGDTDTWSVQIYAFAEPEGYVTMETLKDVAWRTVRGHLADPAELEEFEVAAPVDVDDFDVEITLKSSTDTGTARLHQRHAFGPASPFSEWAEISTTPPLSTPPTTATVFTYATGFPRTYDPSNRRLVRMEIRAVLESGGVEIVSQTKPVPSWYTPQEAT